MQTNSPGGKGGGLQAPETLVILNPVAGGGRADRVWRRLEPKARARLGELLVRRTSRAGEAESVARASAHSTALTLVVGGDGTIHEVVNGLLAERDSARLAVIPAGSGNDFARNLGMPLSAEAAFDRLGRLEPRRVDVGRCATPEPESARLFVNSLSLGVSAQANRVALRLGRAIPGRLRYPLAGFLALLAQGPARYRVSSAGQLLHQGEVLNLTVANGASFGAGLLIAPAARPDDGILDLVLIGPLGRIRALRALSRLRRGAHLSQRGIRVVPLRDPVTITSVAEPGTMLLEADGENFSLAGELSVGILPGRLLLCN